MKTEATKALYALAMSVRQESANPRLFWFGIITGFISLNENNDYNMQVCDFYLYILQQLLPSDIIEVRLSYDNSVPLKLEDVIKVINDTFSAFDYTDYDDYKTAKSQLITNAIIEPTYNYKQVYLDDVIDIVMKAWLSIQGKYIIYIL